MLNRVTVNRPRPEPTPVGQALHLLGDRWTLLILRDAFAAGHRRYQQWRDTLPISDAVLAGRLRDLVAGGVLALERYEERPPRSEYRLTEQGLDLWRVLLSLWAWESEWAEPGRDAGLALTHLRCGADTVPRLACGSCDDAVGLREIRSDVTELGWRSLRLPDFARRRSSAPSDERDATLRREAMAILGDRWSSTVIALAFLGVRRFTDFQRSVAASPAVLSQRLRGLTALGALEHVPVSDGARRREYRLTDKGLAFFPTVVLVLDWADRSFGDGPGTSVVITHLPCGSVLRPAIACGACGERVERQDVSFGVRPPAPAR